MNQAHIPGNKDTCHFWSTSSKLCTLNSCLALGTAIHELLPFKGGLKLWFIHAQSWVSRFFYINLVFLLNGWLPAIPGTCLGTCLGTWNNIKIGLKCWISIGKLNSDSIIYINLLGNAFFRGKNKKSPQHERQRNEQH